MPDDEDELVPFTISQRRRVDRTERAVQGYTDEGGVFVPGLLQNTADAVKVVQTIKKMGWFLLGIAILNVFHLYGLADMLKTILWK